LFVYVRLVTCLDISKSRLGTLLSGKTVYIVAIDLKGVDFVCLRFAGLFTVRLVTFKRIN
jgi:hypothetical protein